jgi:hypothetical protein
MGVFCVRVNWPALLAYTKTACGGSLVLPSALFNGVDIRPARYQEEVDGRAANGKVGEVGAGVAFFTCWLVISESLPVLGSMLKAVMSPQMRGRISRHIANAGGGIGDRRVEHEKMGTGCICLYGDGLIALAGIRSLETQSTLATDGEERNVSSRLIGGRVGGTSDLPGCAAACVQNIDKLTRGGHQNLCGVHPTGAIGRVLGGRQLAKVVINSEAGNLLVLLCRST